MVRQMGLGELTVLTRSGTRMSRVIYIFGLGTLLLFLIFLSYKQKQSTCLSILDGFLCETISAHFFFLPHVAKRGPGAAAQCYSSCLERDEKEN